ncbi:hypothetical protein EAI_16796 [Harpegnathos saltator]|uniref:Uncharacterized protein n=1 Tax=Harpegnathos saltator TaxID=610380 RepID=E2B8E0_HARSA|nr:hypothetical protein EAI_16796 [Harpegnathos saltator]
MACKMSLIGLLAVLYILTYDVTAEYVKVSKNCTGNNGHADCCMTKVCNQVEINGTLINYFCENIRNCM